MSSTLAVYANFDRYLRRRLLAFVRAQGAQKAYFDVTGRWPVLRGLDSNGNPFLLLIDGDSERWLAALEQLERGTNHREDNRAGLLRYLDAHAAPPPILLKLAPVRFGEFGRVMHGSCVGRRRHNRIPPPQLGGSASDNPQPTRLELPIHRQPV